MFCWRYKRFAEKRLFNPSKIKGENSLFDFINKSPTGKGVDKMLKYDECGLMNDSEIEEAKNFAVSEDAEVLDGTAMLLFKPRTYSYIPMMAWV